MSELLPSTPQLAAFVAASIVLAVTPGPGVIYIVASSIHRGRRAGLASAVVRALSRCRLARRTGNVLAGSLLIGLGMYAVLATHTGTADSAAATPA